MWGGGQLPPTHPMIMSATEVGCVDYKSFANTKTWFAYKLMLCKILAFNSDV